MQKFWAILKFPDNGPIMLRNAPYNAQGIGNYSCQIFEKYIYFDTKKVHDIILLQETKNQLSIIVLDEVSM